VKEGADAPTEERNKALTLKGIEEMFNKGELSVVDELVADCGQDHQEAPGTDFAEHLKDVITKMRRAFPDLHFELHHILAEGDMVASRSTMTGTHEGRFKIGLFRDIPPTSRRVEVAHMHFFRWVDGKNTRTYGTHGHAQFDAAAGSGSPANGRAGLRV
jgi:predicted ester cyclase